VAPRDPHLTEHHLAVPRTARYYTLGQPGAATREVWFVLHGYGQLAGRFLRHFTALDDGSRLVVAPEALSRFYLAAPGEPHDKVGAAWMTREDRLTDIGDYVRYLDLTAAAIARGLRRAVPMIALGFSQGTATVARWAALGATVIDRLILWGGEVPPDLDLSAAALRWQRLRLVLVAGERDEYITEKVLARDIARLDEHQIAHEVVRHSGGHEIVESVLQELIDASSV
jgi:predicted esterase